MLYFLTTLLGIILGIIFTVLIIVGRCFVGELRCVLSEYNTQYLVLFEDEETKNKVPKLGLVLLKVTKTHK